LGSGSGLDWGQGWREENPTWVGARAKLRLRLGSGSGLTVGERAQPGVRVQEERVGLRARPKAG